MADKQPTIVDELKQTRPFATAAQEATVALLRTTDLVRRRLTSVVEEEDLTLQQYNVLRILRGSQGRPLCALEIRDRLIEQTPGVSRLLDRLLEKGLIRRDRSSTDRRLLECFISGKGLDVLARLDSRVNEADAQVLDALSAVEIKTLNKLLSKIRRSNR